jgi:uncharacterized protein YraI
MSRNRFVSLLFVICMALAACNLPSSAPTGESAGEGSPTPTPVSAEVPSATPTPAAAAVADCSAIVTTNTDANVRGGPGQVYNILGVIPQGGTAAVSGRNSEGTWWYIQFAAGPGGYAWIAGSVTTATCIPTALAVIAAPPTPIVPTAVPSSTTAPGGPSPTPVPGLTFVFDPGIIVIDPGLIFINTSTPTPVFIVPVFPTLDCWFC